MCGIAGAISNNLPTTQTLVNTILDTQHPRGPDHRAVTKINTDRGNILLGHNRLSIIDLHTRSDQPMWDPSKNFCIVFNGEIYNYLEIREELKAIGTTFNTTSDTEVILQAYAAWGIDCINKFNGMFALALFDKPQQKLWLVRDRFGV